MTQKGESITEDRDWNINADDVFVKDYEGHWYRVVLEPAEEPSGLD